jgi:NAD(P)-dependent dehydrogenase (short-subunit alcohol dehydrogenase family)
MSAVASFENQGFLVVNGTQGIAPALILRAAQRHATVVFTAPNDCARDAEQLVQRAATAGLSERVSFIAADLADESSVEQLGDAALERLPGLSALIHNLEPRAVLERKSLIDISLAEWNGVLATELRVPFMLARRAVEEYLFGQAGGRIVYVAYAGCDGTKPPASYAAAQTCLRALVRCITKEFGRREVACNAVVAYQDHGQVVPDELIESVLFFASTESAFVNGEFLDIGYEKC